MWLGLKSMEKASGLEYRALIERLSESSSFEAEGDAVFLAHEDSQARLLWAFYRPSGSHPSQLQDKDPVVAAMGFSHSRLGALKRLRLLNPEVLKSDALRQKISKRARMLFRALADDDFCEMAMTVEEFPVYAELSVDQLINGRKMIEDIRLDIASVNAYLYLVNMFWNEAASAVLRGRLKPWAVRGEEEAAKILRETNALDSIHPILAQIVAEVCEEAAQNATHPLKKIAFQKEIAKLTKVSHG